MRRQTEKPRQAQGKFPHTCMCEGWGEERKLVKQQLKKGCSFFHEVLIRNSRQWGQLWPQTKALSLERTDQGMVNTQAARRHTQFRIPTLPPRGHVILEHCLRTLIVFKMQIMTVCLLKLMREFKDIIHVKYLAWCLFILQLALRTWELPLINDGSTYPTDLAIVLTPNQMSCWRTHLHSAGCYSSSSQGMQTPTPPPLDQTLHALDSIQIPLVLIFLACQGQRMMLKKDKVLDSWFLKAKWSLQNMRGSAPFLQSSLLILSRHTSLGCNPVQTGSQSDFLVGKPCKQA